MLPQFEHPQKVLEWALWVENGTFLFDFTRKFRPNIPIRPGHHRPVLHRFGAIHFCSRRTDRQIRRNNTRKRFTYRQRDCRKLGNKWIRPSKRFCWPLSSTTVEDWRTAVASADVEGPETGLIATIIRTYFYYFSPLSTQSPWGIKY